MTDPGWDIPGVPRAAPSDAGAPAAVGGSVSSATASSGSVLFVSAWSGSSRRRAGSRRRARAGSVSACSGLSAGAFAPLRDSSAPAAPWPADSASVSAGPGLGDLGTHREGYSDLLLERASGQQTTVVAIPAWHEIALAIS